MKKILFVLFIMPYIIYSQGLIINEFSNGTSGVGAGTQEYIEMLVLGDPSNPTAPVNIGGQIIDDNNGSFETSVGTGVAPGHLRINPTCYNAVLPGSIILIYNAADRNALIPADDPTDSNNDMIYIIPHTNTCIQANTTVPNATTPTLTYTSGSYTNTTISSQNNCVGFRNGGDAIQIRRPNASFYYGYCYGDVTAPYPTIYNGSSSFNVNTSAGTSSSYYLNCLDFTNSTNISTTSSGLGTPASFNNPDNQMFILNIQNGTFNYSNYNDPNNCLIPMPILTLNGSRDKDNNIMFEFDYIDNILLEEYDMVNQYSVDINNKTIKSNKEYFRLRFNNAYSNVLYLKNNPYYINNNNVYYDGKIELYNLLAVKILESQGELNIEQYKGFNLLKIDNKYYKL